MIDKLSLLSAHSIISFYSAPQCSVLLYLITLLYSSLAFWFQNKCLILDIYHAAHWM